MPTLTIPKEIIKKEDKLIRVPRNEYKAFLQWRKIAEHPREFKTFKPTKAQLKDLEDARKERRRGVYLTFDELKHWPGSDTYCTP